MDEPRWPVEWPLVVCEDGPRAGAWYFEKAEHGQQHSWEAQVKLARQQVEEFGGTDVNTLGYVMTDEVVDSRKLLGVKGKVMRWQPGDVAD